jgi:hypothetical protein
VKIVPAELLMKNRAAPVRRIPAVPARRQPKRHLSLVSDQLGLQCPLLPARLTALVPRIGWTWIDPDSLLPHHRSWRKGDQIRDPGNFPCPLREPGLLGERAGLLWIDDARYPSAQDWIDEARVCGPSLQVASVPDGFSLGQTWVLVAHRAAFGNAPGVIHVFQPTRVDEVELPTAA